MPLENSSPPDLQIEVFGFDVAEISQIRRIKALRSLGHDVHSFTMRRDNMNQDFVPDWPNTHLYDTENENLPKRVAVVLGSIVKMLRHRARIRAADMLIARNLDMLAIAWAARLLAGARQVPLVYECLDINGALCGNGKKARLMRAAERRLLADVQMLVVSSPGFIRSYFTPLQGYKGAWGLWENKLAAGAALPERPSPDTSTPAMSGPESTHAENMPLRLGWVGTIRCAPSLSLLTEVARQLGPKVEIHIHGVVHYHVLPDFDATVAAHDNIIFHGAYAYPDDLSRIYGGLDLVWAQDLWQAGSNSDWLLPNRIYEASWAGCPCIAVAGTETGRRINDDRLGWTIEQPEAAELLDLLAQLERTEIAARRRDLLSRPETDFVQSPQDLTAVLQELCPCPQP